MLDKNFLAIDVLNQKRLNVNSGKLDCLFLKNKVKSLIRFAYINIRCVQF